MEPKPDRKPETKPSQAEPKPRAERAKDETEAPLDFAKLDLRVDTVDERISPSETNVFDK